MLAVPGRDDGDEAAWFVADAGTGKSYAFADHADAAYARRLAVQGYEFA